MHRGRRRRARRVRGRVGRRRRGRPHAWRRARCRRALRSRGRASPVHRFITGPRLGAALRTTGNDSPPNASVVATPGSGGPPHSGDWLGGTDQPVKRGPLATAAAGAGVAGVTGVTGTTGSGNTFATVTVADSSSWLPTVTVIGSLCGPAALQISSLSSSLSVAWTSLVVSSSSSETVLSHEYVVVVAPPSAVSSTVQSEDWPFSNATVSEPPDAPNSTVAVSVLSWPLPMISSSQVTVTVNVVPEGTSPLTVFTTVSERLPSLLWPNASELAPNTPQPACWPRTNEER